MADTRWPGRGGNRDAGRGSFALGSDDAPQKSMADASAQDSATRLFLCDSAPPQFDEEALERELDDDRAYFADVPFEGLRASLPRPTDGAIWCGPIPTSSASGCGARTYACWSVRGK